MKLFIWGESGFIGQLLKKHFKIKHLDVNLIGRGENCHHVINITHSTQIPYSIDSSSIVFFLSAISSPDICSNDSSNSKNISSYLNKINENHFMIGEITNNKKNNSGITYKKD